MRIITRAEWNARAPKTIVRVPWSKRTGFAVHYSGANKLQTVRSIQDYCMDVRKFSDIDYNMLADYKGNAYEGRGWDVRGSHILNHNTENVGACAIGTDADVTDEQKHALRWLYDEACRRAGKTLVMRYHSMYGNTSCPGDKLRAWVIAGMPDPLAPTKPSAPDFPGKVLVRSQLYSVHVKLWQARMRVRGWTIIVDGVLGPQTQKIVKAFQAEKKLKVTGTINKETWYAAWHTPITQN